MSVTCRHVRQLHDAYIDRELPAGLTAEVHAHLLQCPACQQEVEMVRACGGVIASDRSEPQLDAGFTARMAAMVAERAAAKTIPFVQVETRRDRRWRQLRSFAITAVPAVAAMLFFAILIRPGDETPTPVTAVRGVTVEQAGVKGMVEPSISALSQTRQAVQDLGQLCEIAATDAASGATRAMDRSIGTDGKVTTTGPSLLDFFLPTFDEIMRPAGVEPEKSEGDAELIRL